MTVKELKELINNLSDDLPVAVRVLHPVTGFYEGTEDISNGEVGVPEKVYSFEAEPKESLILGYN